jgi:beta-lactamase class A
LVIPTRDEDKRERVRSARAGRHRAAGGQPNFSGGFRALGELAYQGAQVSASVLDLGSRALLVSIDDRVAMPTASIGKVLLLIEVSARITARDFAGYGILDKTPGDNVADSGIWRHLQAPALPVADLAALVGATSDNLATNVLLRAIGLDAVRGRAESLGLKRMALLDLVRNRRGPDDAPQLSIGSASELAWLFGALSRGEVVDPVTSQRVLGWLSLNTDLSMVASAFGLDPLAHREDDHGVLLVNKTGTDTGIRAEAGVVRSGSAGVAYAVTIQFDDTGLASRLRVLDAMRTFGGDLLEYLH